MTQNYGLGRGLSSLIPQKNTKSKTKKKDVSFQRQVSPVGDFFGKEIKSEVITKNDKGNILEVDVEKIITNPYQPRVEFDKEKLKELSDSIGVHGIIQPLVVTKKGENFELIAGERRLQASKLAGLKKVPVIIKDIKDKEKLELAIVENIQRHNLNPVEEAKAYKQLMDEFEMNQEEVAKKMGKSRSVVANKLRLLSLPIEAIKALREGKITEGHAKAILALENPEKQRGLLGLIIKNQLTVRQAENKTKAVSIKAHKRVIEIDPETKDLEDRFSATLGTKVKIKKVGGKGGKIIIDYYSSEDLSKIVSKLK